MQHAHFRSLSKGCQTTEDVDVHIWRGWTTDSFLHSRWSDDGLPKWQGPGPHETSVNDAGHTYDVSVVIRQAQKAATAMPDRMARIPSKAMRPPAKQEQVVAVNVSDGRSMEMFFP